MGDLQGRPYGIRNSDGGMTAGVGGVEDWLRYIATTEAQRSLRVFTTEFTEFTELRQGLRVNFLGGVGIGGT